MGNAKFVTETFPVCPQCGTPHKSSVDTLTYFGTWYCDSCGQGIRGTWAAESGWTITLEAKANDQYKTLVLLKLDSESQELYFVVEGMVSAPSGAVPEIDHEHQEYFYEEHSCPTNFIRCEAIIENGDCDPHGVVTYVTSVLKPKDWGDGQKFIQDWRTLFPMLPEPTKKD